MPLINKQRVYEHALFQESQFRKAYTESSLMAYEINLTRDTIQRISGVRGFRLEEVKKSLTNPNCYSELLEKATDFLVMQGMIQTYLENLVPSGKIQAFMMTDLNHFKHLNDTHGHLIGDHCLIKWAASLKGQFRKEDIVARMGGDEFAVLLKNLPDEQAAISIAKKLIASSKKVGEELGLDLDTTVSIGISFAPRHGMDFEKLYSQADKAMYCAKRTGDGHIAVFEEDALRDSEV